jgi:hypothetical protein
MIVLDAFTSDAIPIHLITRQAVQLYLSKLRMGGIILFHISNRYLDLGPVVSNVAADLGLVARRWNDNEDGDDSDPKTSGKAAADWVIVARHNADFAKINRDARWKPLLPVLDKDVWTDDYSNLFGALIR